ncbi:ABC transporter permease [Saccharothrix yanglingensis]|uniref:ABC transporter permease n=1 Tax=Saccharothrix yanglingensis TaxID=659496 RepID=A0ABU0WRJ8_9PSEU|nr:ABC-2 family transporter protein [Saccharothrix yanglingensis]MDQ2582426.1 ABC transporter permease [Saccharothrix yanglingensis]
MAERVYPKLVGARLRGQTSYRASFALQCVSSGLGQLVELGVILILFGRVTSLGGFSVTEVVLMYAIAGVGFGLADMVAGQLDELPAHTRTGTFDVVLMRPLGTLAQVMASDLHLRKIGRIVASLVALVWALAHNDIAWSPATALLVVLAPLSGAVIFSSIWVVANAVCFWLVEGQELANAVTYGSGSFVAYYPGLALLGRPDPLGGPALLGWVSPLVAVATAAVAGLVWRFAVRHYRGTGS